MTMEATRTYTDAQMNEESRPAFGVAPDRWLDRNRVPTLPTSVQTHTENLPASNAWLSPETISQAKQRFKDALEDAAEEEEAAPSDKVLANALRAVRIMDGHCPQNVSSTVVLDGGIEATVRGSNRNYISVECENSGEVLVMFNVRSYARYKDMDEAEQSEFLKNLLGTLRY